MASSRPMSDHVTCGVCMEQYDRTDHIPKLLPCQHTFCLACLLSLERSSSSMSIECPMCRSQHEGSPHDFTTNRMAMDIAEELQQQASSSQSFRSQQASLSLSCSAHADIESVLVCVDCLAGICAKCVKKHRDHQLEDMQDAKTLLRERFVDETRKQLSLLKTEMGSASSVREITRAEGDIIEMCAHLISVITKWQTDQLSIIGEIKTKAAKREQEMKVQSAKLEAILQNDIDISTLIRHLTQKEKISCQIPKGNTYNFMIAHESMLADLTSSITSENSVNSKFLQDQSPKTTSLATPPNQTPQKKPAPQIPAGASPARRDNQQSAVKQFWDRFCQTRTNRDQSNTNAGQGRNVMKNKGQQQQKGPARVRKEKLQAVLSDNPILPSYWIKNTASGPQLVCPEDLLANVDAKTYAAVNRLVKESWVQQFVGQATVSVGLSYRNIKVQKVQRIENPEAYLRYRTELQRACQAALKRDYPAITSINNEPEVLTATLNIPELEAIRLREVNEYFLFHGVSCGELYCAVSGSGLDWKGLFGRGLYLSECSTKADQHADNSTARGPLHMVVYRAILGHIYPQRGASEYTKSPCRHWGCREGWCSHDNRYDSVMGIVQGGGVRPNFREFVFFNSYDKKHTYPEFLITYKRV